MNLHLEKAMDAPDDYLGLASSIKAELMSFGSPRERLLHTRRILQISHSFRKLIPLLEHIEEDTLKVLLINFSMDDKQNQIEDKEEWLTVKELCILLDCGESTIYGWVNKRLVPYYKVESGVRFLKSEIMEWIRNKRVRTTTEIRQRASTQN